MDEQKNLDLNEEVLAEVESVSLEELGDSGNEAPQESAQPAEAPEPEDAAQPEETPPEPESVDELNQLLEQNAQTLRAQFAEENAEALALAEAVKRAFPGMTAQQVQERLLQAQAQALAEETGWSEEEALEKLKARARYEQPVAPEDAHLTLLRSQVADVKRRTGLDMAQIIQKDEYLTQQINSKAMDVKDAYAWYLEHSLKRKPAPVDTRAGAAARPASKRLSDADIKRIDEALKRGVHVRVD